MNKKYLVQVTVSIEVEGEDLDADGAADYAQSLLIDDGYTIDDVCQPMLWENNTWEEVEE